MNYAALIWLALVVVFLIAEGATVALVSIWFAVGALAAMVAALLHGNVALQLVLFFAVSGVLLGCLRPFARKYLKPKAATNVDAIVGTEGYVTEAVDNLSAVGQVSLNGMPWTARSTDGAPIEAGTLVRVDKVEGVKVFVTPVPQKS